MNEDFVSFDIAKKLKEKGFSCEMPFAMYNEIAAFHLLTTSAPYNVCDSGFKYREYYDYEDFDEHDCIAPTISQVLKWLRKEKGLHIEILHIFSEETLWDFEVAHIGSYERWWNNLELFDTYEQAVLAGIKYVLDNLI